MSEIFLNLCRCCLNDEPDDLLDMKSQVFSSNEKQTTFYQGYRELSGLTQNEIFTIPTGKGPNEHKICKMCVTQLESCYTFRELCQQANTILADRYLMQAHNQSVMEEEDRKPNIKDLQVEDNFLEPMPNQYSMVSFAQTGKPIMRDPSMVQEKFPCPKCDKSFKYVSLLNQHALTHCPPKIRKFRCEICMASYKHHLSLQSHMRTAHEIVPPNSAIERSLRPSAPVAATNVFHMEITNPTLDLPTEDPETFILNIKDEPQDELPETNGPTEDDETFRCTDCDQTFQFRSEFNQHLAMHNGKQEEDDNDSNSGTQKYKCNQCTKVAFLTPGGLYHHMQTQHNLLRHKCTYCHKKFTRKSTLLEHNCKAKEVAEHPIVAAVHSSALMSIQGQGGVLNCPEPYCEYQTDMRENFQVHLETVHSYNYNGQPPEPGYNEDSMLNPEIEMNDQSQEQDENAMRMFCYENLLSPQMTLETDFNNSADNSNDFSNSDFTATSDFNASSGLVTNGGDGKHKYQCRECSRSFQYPSYYKQHMISHSSEKNFKCTYCPSEYKHEKSLVEHFQKHIKEGKVLPSTVQQYVPTKYTAPQYAAPQYAAIVKQEVVSAAAAVNSPAPDSDTNGESDNELADETYAPRSSGSAQKDPKTGKFYCKLCCKHYQYLSNYKQHMIRHSDIKKHKCNLCPMTYKTEKSYIGHMKAHEEGTIPAKPSVEVVKKEKPEENFYKCKQCSKTLQSQGGLYHHVQTVHKNFRFFCKLCHQTFTTKKSLQRHMYTHKEKAFLYNCSEFGCKFFTNIKQRLAVHLLNKHNLKYKEELHGCLKSMTDNTRAKLEPERDDDEAEVGSENNLSNQNAEENFDPGNNSADDEAEGEQEQDEDDEAEDEGESSTAGNMIVPEVIIHTNEEEESDTESQEYDPLDANPSTSSQNMNTNPDSDDCMIVDDNDVLSVNTGKRLKLEYPCTECSHTCITYQQLKRHISAAHNHAKRFKCTVCPAAFQVEKNLEFHMNTHKTPIKETPATTTNDAEMLQCPQCDKTLYSKSGLYHHIKSRHENVKYACRLCDKEFTTKDMLWQHSFHHCEDCPWPFICKELGCEFRTKGKSLFQTHLKSVHSMKYDDEIHGYHDRSFQEVIDSVLDTTKLKKKKIKLK